MFEKKQLLYGDYFDWVLPWWNASKVGLIEPNLTTIQRQEISLSYFPPSVAYQYFELFSFQTHSNIYPVKYENIKANPQDEVKKLATFLGHSLTDEQINSIVRYLQNLSTSGRMVFALKLLRVFKIIFCVVYISISMVTMIGFCVKPTSRLSRTIFPKSLGVQFGADIFLLPDSGSLLTQ